MSELLLPGGCAACDEYLPADQGPWCPDCAIRIGQAIRANYCTRCGLTSQQATPTVGCPRCMTTENHLDGFARVGEYSGLLRDLIRRFKFGKRLILDRPLGDMLAAAVQRHGWHCELDGLVPVPTVWRSRREYSFSPPGAIAQQVGDELRLPVLPIIREHGKARRQVGLDHPDRARNVRNVYHLRSGAKPAGGIFCLIDDVSTSGATLQEIAKVLKESGVTRVYAAVLAKTNPEHAASHGT